MTAQVIRVTDEKLTWLHSNNIGYTIIETVICPQTFGAIPWRVAIINDADYTWYMVRWS